MNFSNNFSLKKYNSFGIEAKAKYFSGFSTREELEFLLQSTEVKLNQLLVLGGGSNILLTDDYNGVVLKNEIKGIETVEETDEHYIIKAGAGENWHGFVMHCVENDFAGVENLSLIPGNVGASPMQNIGAYGVEIKDVFEELEAFHIKDKVMHKFSIEDCAFGYRESVFKNKHKGEFIITSVSFRLYKKPFINTSYGAIQQELENMGVNEPGIKDVSRAVINIRSSKLPDPAMVGNAGSFFKNPMVDILKFEELKDKYSNIVAFPSGNGKMKLAAGWLIEQCGWKGFRKGDAGCYPKQALVLVNYGNAAGKEIYDLSESIIQSVREKFGVELEREVNVVGVVV